MSVLKVFISSTCYDLDNVRDGLRDFIYNIGYEPVMSDYGDVLYDPRIHTHTSCIEEVKNCDMLVLLIGGRFGGKAISEAVSVVDFEKVKEKIKAGIVIDDERLSITHLEVLKAMEFRYIHLLKMMYLVIINCTKKIRISQLLVKLYFLQ